MSNNSAFPAFPLPQGSETADGYQGMSLRDYFACAAMQAFITNENRHRAMTREEKDPKVCDLTLAIAAYDIADAMIVIRDGKEGA